MTSSQGAERRRFPAARIALIAILCGILAVLLQVLALLLALTSTRRGYQPTPAPLVQRAVATQGLQRAEFLSEDRVALRGEILGAPDRQPLVVFGHGFRLDRRQGDPLAEALLDAGYAVFLFDFRGSGESGGRFTTLGAREAADVRAALRYVRTLHHVLPSRIAYVGFSMGAAAAILDAEDLAPLAGAVLIAPYARLEDTLAARTEHFALLPLRPLFAPALFAFEKIVGMPVESVQPIARIGASAPCPLLLIGGDLDWRVPPADLYALRDARGAETELVLIPGFDHRDLQGLPLAVRTYVLRFLATHLPLGVG